MTGAPGSDEQTRVFEAARRLYGEGRYLSAWRIAAPLGPLPSWRGEEQTTLAGCLAMQLGNAPLALRLHVALRRLYPESETSWCWLLRAVRLRWGPYAAQTLLRRGGPAAEPGAEALAFAASTAAALKDFQQAERLIARAEALAPEDAWIRVERSAVLRAADDYSGALAAAEQALRLRPFYRPAVEAQADLLVLLGREQEALAVLQDGMRRFESTGVAFSLLQLQVEHLDLVGAEDTLRRIEELAPLRTRAFQEHLAGRRSDVAWLRGDREATIRLAQESKSPFHERLAERLVAGRSGPRVLLPVPFVRQHDLTCAPATLAALARFHGVEAEHLEIAEEICYDGTPDWAQRRWAEQQGFLVREFTVTWAAARGLVDRGLPFALTTVEPGSAHLQAVVGYDEGRGTLLIRDPTFRSMAELAEPGIEDYRACGPRGMVLVPSAKEAWLDGVALPEAELHDVYHRVQASLVAHRREEAEQACRALEAQTPGHRLALFARRALAGYDEDEEARLAATERLLALFPDDVNLRLSKQASLATLGRRLAQTRWLRDECARAGHPLLDLALGDAIRMDARALPEVQRLARRVVRARPYDAGAYRLLAHTQWERLERAEALHTYRVATCLGWTEEYHAESYFRAARVLGRVDEGLDLLRWRVQRQGSLSARPAMTLHEALDAVERTAEGLVDLDRAIAGRPDDGPLLLFAARARAAAGDLPTAESLVERARAAAPLSLVLRTRAWLAERAGQQAHAASLWTDLAELDPLDTEASRSAVRLIAATQGKAAALAMLRRLLERFPHHHGLRRLLVDWLDDEPPETVETELRLLLELHPQDAWAWRELAAHLSRRGDHPAALQALEQAEAIDPAAVALHNVRGAVLRDMGRLEDAKRELLRALSVDADDGWALGRLLELAADVEERRGTLRVAVAEMRRQVSMGDGILGFQRLAQPILEPRELAEELELAHRLRPDLWHAWVALARQHAFAGQLDAAGALLEEAARRFPLLPRIAVEQAQLALARGDHDERRRALERAVMLSPGWTDAARELATLLQDRGEYQAELAVLDRALRESPHDEQLHGWRADALHLLGRTDDAIEELEKALRLDPAYGWAWETLQRLCGRGSHAPRPRALAEAVVRERPHDARSWLLLARASDTPNEKLSALDRALEAWPRYLAAWELRVDLLAESGRWDEARAAAHPAVFGPVPPRSLRLRHIRIRSATDDRPGAMRDLRRLLKDEPDDLEAWQLRADWEEEAGDLRAALAAARELVRLAPLRAVSHGYLGHALLAGAQRDEGKAALRRAVSLDAGYTWALHRLLAAEIEDADVEAAEHTLGLVAQREGEGAACWGRIRLALRLGRPPEALEVLGRLSRCESGWDGASLAKAFDEAGQRRAFDAELRRLVAEPGTMAGMGRLWAGLQADAKRWREGRRTLEAILAPIPPGRAALGAAAEWLERLARAGRAREVRRFVERHGPRLRGDTDAWASAGFALSRTESHRECAGWLGDWQKREGLEPWMLLNLAQSLRDLHRVEEAATVNAAALRLPRDHSSALHRIHLEADAALAATPSPLDGEPPPDSGYYRRLFELAAAIRAAQRAPSRQAWAAALPHFERARAERNEGRFLSSYRRQAIRIVAFHRGGRLAFLWELWGLWRMGSP